MWETLATTDTPLPLPAGCLHCEHVATEPDRLRGALVAFADAENQWWFDGGDVKAAEGMLARAEERKAGLVVADHVTSEAAGAVANEARRCNKRWEVVMKMVAEGILRTDDELFQFLVQRQFAMRREVLAHIRALGDEYM